MIDDQGEKAQASRQTTENYGSLQPGTVIGRYEIVSVLGQGGFGITYRARDTQLERDVAIKEYLPSSLAVRHEDCTVLPRSTAMADDFVWGRERFLDEAKTMARFGDAPAIVRVHDFLEANGTAYVVMPLLKGETLEARLQRETRLQQPAIERIVYPLFDGLEQVHAAGFLHRDIKPANIILAADGSPTLIDFGASRAAMQGRTQAITAVYTPGYAPLEQLASGKQGPWTDIYALAATFYACVNGKPPRNALNRMIGEPIVPAAEVGKRRYAPSLLAAIDAGLVLKAENRPQTIDEWREILTTGQWAQSANLTAAAAVDVGATRRVVPRPAAPEPIAVRRNRLPLYAGLGAAVVALSIGGYFVLASKLPPQGAALQDLKVEDLERALAERRAADAAAAEKRRLEEEAQRKAEADAASKRAADAELEKARQDRQKAEEELARLKAEIEARRQAAAGQPVQAGADPRRAAEEAAQHKAEAEMAALRQAEADARKKAADEAETKRQADEALAKAQADRQKADEAAAALKQKADAEAKQKADAEAAALAEKKTAEAAESALRLATVDRQHLQVALTSLGFDTHGFDGAFGSRSREMIAAWQKARNQPATGFLTNTQQQVLLKEAAVAVSKYDDEQKKIEDDKKKADDAKAAAAPTAPAPAASTPSPAPPAAAPAAPSAGAYDGNYSGIFQGPGGPRPITLRISNGSGSGTLSNPNCGIGVLSVSISPAGDVSGEGQGYGRVCDKITLGIRGRAANGQLLLTFSGPGVSGPATMTRRGN